MEECLAEKDPTHLQQVAWELAYQDNALEECSPQAKKQEEAAQGALEAIRSEEQSHPNA